LGRAVSHEITVKWPGGQDSSQPISMRLNRPVEVTVTIGPGLMDAAATGIQAASRGAHTRDQALERLTSKVMVTLWGTPDAFLVSNVADGSVASRPWPYQVDKTLTLNAEAPATLGWEVTPTRGGWGTLRVALSTVVRDGQGQAQPATQVWSDPPVDGPPNVQVSSTVPQSALSTGNIVLHGAQAAGQLWPLLIPLALLAGAVVAIRHRRLRQYAFAVFNKAPGLGGLAEAAMGDAEPAAQATPDQASERVAGVRRAFADRSTRVPAARKRRHGHPTRRMH
jgi:hypothetical protein